MVAKRKAASMLATKSTMPATKATVASKVEEEELDLESQIVAAAVESKVLKRPAAAPKEEEEEEDMEVEEISEEERVKRHEKEVVAQRTPELKSMSMDALKSLLTKAGLPTGKKDDMIKTILKQEAKDRAEAREHEAKIRAVVISKKEELEGLSLTDLGKLCDSKGIKCGKAKPERIERLLVQWQEQDGVEKGLAELAREERREELSGLEKDALREMCEKVDIDFCVKEVMVERISKREYDIGRYARSAPKEDSAPQAKLDMVQALIANESNRKKEKAVQSQQEEEAANKKKELKAMSLDDLKKAMGKRGLEVAGKKKEDMVEALYQAEVEEQATTARKSELKKMGAAALKELLASKGLEPASKGAGAAIEAVLAHEAKCREEQRAFESKVGEVLAQKKLELEKTPNGALKDMCAKKGLAVGGGKEEKAERLLEEAQRDGEIDRIISKMLRDSRNGELMSMDKLDLLKLCEKMEVDPLVKEVMLERILAYEDECEEPVTKKARK